MFLKISYASLYPEPLHVQHTYYLRHEIHIQIRIPQHHRHITYLLHLHIMRKEMPSQAVAEFCCPQGNKYAEYIIVMILEIDFLSRGSQESSNNIICKIFE